MARFWLLPQQLTEAAFIFSERCPKPGAKGLYAGALGCILPLGREITGTIPACESSAAAREQLIGRNRLLRLAYDPLIFPFSGAAK